jgi:hypothetical protein
MRFMMFMIPDITEEEWAPGPAERSRGSVRPGDLLAPERTARAGQTAAISRTWVRRRWLPDGSRNPASIP